MLSLGALAFISGALAFGAAAHIEASHAANEIVYDVGYARSNPDAHLQKGDNNNYNYLYFELDETKAGDAPYNSDWSLRYKPTTEDAVRLVRDGVTYNIANPAAETIIKLSKTKCELQTWMVNGKLPASLQPFTIQHGDQIIIGGTFTKTVDTVVHKLVISETIFMCSMGREIGGQIEKTYFAAIPQNIIDVPNEKVAMNAASWHMMFDIKDLSEADAPHTGGDNKNSYFPTSSDCFFVDGKPYGRVTTCGLWRWDKGQFNWYPTVNDDIQGILQYVSVGSVLVIDGIFTYQGEIASYENFERLGLRFHMLAFQKFGDGANDYIIINLHDYLSDSIHDEFQVEDFISEDQDAALTALDTFDAEIVNKGTTRSSYELYNETIAALSALTVDEQVLINAKQQAIQTISSYADLNNYYDDEQTIINGYISQYTALINEASKRIEVNRYVAEFKDLVDDVQTKADVMADAVAHQEKGYEKYLENSDEITLYDLGYSEDLTFHGKLNDRKSDVNTNSQENNVHNTFAPSVDNPNGNVKFHFRYEPNAHPIGGANVFFVLRGIALYGYKFAVDTSARSCYVQIIDQSGNAKSGGGTKDNIFTNGEAYEITLGAIDLVDEIGRTWIFIEVDGNIVLSNVVESLSFCTNARVGITCNDNWDSSNDYEGTATVSNSSLALTQSEGFFAGRLSYSDGSSDEIHATLDNNALPFNKDGLEVSYVNRPENIQLIRNDETTNVGKVGTPLLKKISEKDYIFDVFKCVEIQDNDIIYISGLFYYFSDSEHAKTAFTISVSRFQYHADTDSWTQILTLSEAQEEAIKKLENYVDLSKYDKEEQDSISEIITVGKAQISHATTIEQVDSIYANYKARIDAVKTTFRKYQDSSIEIVNDYKANELNKYRQDEKDEIAALKQAAIADINAATSQEAVDEIVVNLKIDIDELKTNEEYLAIELEDAIKDGQQRIYSHYSSIDTSKYSDIQREALDKETKAAIEAVKGAKSIEEVERIVNEYINSHKSGSGSKKGCNSSLLSSGSFIVFAAAMGGLLIVLRQSHQYRKEEE